MAPLPPLHREAIRAIFLRKRIEYTASEAASLLRMTVGDVLALIESGTLHAVVRRKRKQLGGPRHTIMQWSELAAAAMLRWTVVQIHDALGAEANRVLPPLLRPVELEKVRLPKYLVSLLETLAQRSGVTLEAYVYTVLLDLEVAADPETMEKLLPGFKEAVRFPYV